MNKLLQAVAGIGSAILFTGMMAVQFALPGAILYIAYKLWVMT